MALKKWWQLLSGQSRAKQDKSQPRRAGKWPRPMVEVLEDRLAPTVAFALSGTNLLRFDTASPTIVQTTAITNVTAGETLVGIDFRPQNGLLYGLGVNATADNATLYAISTRTGFAGVVGTAGGVAFTTDGSTAVDLPDPAAVGYGIDFNPAVDRFRVVAGSLNFRVNPNTGVGVDGDNTGLTSGTVSGTNPDGATTGGTVNAAAYTNNQPNNGGITTLYTLDASADSLFIQNPANVGTQTLGQTVTLGGITLDFTAINGFDIPAGVNAPSSNAAVTAGSAFAVLNVGGTTGLYSIDLTNAQATFVGNVGNGSTAVQGFAVQSDLGGLPAISLTAAVGLNLSRFNTSTPTSVTAPSITGVIAGEQLVGIDFRPQTGQLYGLGVDDTADTATLYLIDPQTGVVTVVGTASQIAFVDAGGSPVDFPSAAAGYGFDFNPTVDRIRVTLASTAVNVRVNPNNGAPVDGDLNLGAGTVAGINTDAAINGNGSTGVSATAYTNSFGQSLSGGVTTLYTLDAGLNTLFIQNPANAGTQVTPLPITLGGSPLNFIDINGTGFDIPAGVRVTTSGTAASGRGLAVLNVGGLTRLFSIDLATGVATDFGNVGGGAALAGLTLGDAPAGTVAFASATASVAENGGSATISLNRTGGSNGELTVTVNVTGGTATAGGDFTAGPYTATFADGATTASFTIPIIDDNIFEGSETIVLSIASVNNAGAIGAPSVTTVTIAENDPQQTFNVTDAQGYALSAGTLIPFSTTNPGAAFAPIPLVGITAGETLVAIDFRPQNGLLYGLGVNATTNTATLYAISPRAGFAAVVGTASSIAYVQADGATPVDFPDPATVGYDMDFNPAVDRLRVVAGSLNFRVDPNTGLPIDGNLNSGTPAGVNTDGNVNGGTTAVQGTAYTNNFPNNGNTTTQYTLDAISDILFIQNPPNAGTQTAGLGITLGGTTLDFTGVQGFDILANVNAPASNAAPATGFGFAILTVAGADALYRIDLTTGVATALGGIGATPVSADSLALQSDLDTIPGIGLSASGTQLLRGNDLTRIFAVNITGITSGEQLVGIDFRPQTGQLFGLGVNATANNATLYRIDPQTGAATAIGAASGISFVDATIAMPVDLPDPATSGYGFDFNPTVDRIRVTTSTGLNFRVNPNTGAGVDNDANAGNGTNPDAGINAVNGISATAYTNSFGRDTAVVGPTSQYTLDADTNTLFIQTPPNSGTQTAPLAVTLNGGALDFTAVNGFDIPASIGVTTSGTAVTSGFGFATLTVGGTTSLFSINLTTGAAAALSAFGAGTSDVIGLTLANTPAGTVSFTAATFNVTEAGPSATITLTRASGFSGALTVTIAATGGSATAVDDFAAGPFTATFADGALSASFTIPIVDDPNFEGSETVVLTITNVSNTGVAGAPNTTTLTIAASDPTANVSGAVFADFDGDRVQDAGDTGLVGRTVFLDQNANSLLDGGELSAVTGTGGAYSFTGIPPGTYTFRLVTKGFEGVIGANGAGTTLVLTGGQNLTGINLGQRVLSAVGPLPTDALVFAGTFADDETDLVQGFYRALLGRAGETAGVSFWVNFLRATSATDVIQGFLGSSEFRTLQVQKYYQVLLGRAGEASGVAFAVSQMGLGLSSTDIATAFLISPEFALGAPSNQAFVEKLYRLLLSREGDAAEVASFTGLLNSGAHSRTQVIAAFFDSAESRNRALDSLFAQLLQRPVDPTGQAGFQKQASTGVGLNQIIVSLLASNEFFQKRTD